MIRCPGCGYTIDRMLEEDMEVLLERPIEGVWTAIITEYKPETREAAVEGISKVYEPTSAHPTVYCGNCRTGFRPRTLQVGILRDEDDAE